MTTSLREVKRKGLGLQHAVVGADGAFLYLEWRQAVDTFRRGDSTACVVTAKARRAAEDLASEATGPDSGALGGDFAAAKYKGGHLELALAWRKLRADLAEPYRQAAFQCLGKGATKRKFEGKYPEIHRWLFPRGSE